MPASPFGVRSFRNAAGAIEDQGTITITSARRGANVDLEVQDTGKGIPAERLSRLFEPASQVDSARMRTGNWGLFVSQSIISQHGGRIEIDSREGQGTLGRMLLPVASETHERASERAKPS